jgi:hypothetical protein
MPMNRKGRKTLFPEVPRVFHSGYKGTHSDISWYERYFRDIKLNEKGLVQMGLYDKQKKQYSLEYLKDYDKYIYSKLNPKNPKTKYLKTLNDIMNYKNHNIILFYPSHDEVNNLHWNRISQYFYLWQ